MPTFTNQAHLSYNNQTTASNIAVGELVSVLSGTKTSLNTSYKHNDSITYMINLVNSGGSPILGITIDDNLGAITIEGETVYPLSYRANTISYSINGVSQPIPTITSEEPLSISGLNLPANGNATLIYETLVTGDAPLEAGSSITNTATVSSSDITSFTITATVPVSNEPELTITKSVEPVPVTENGILTYTFLIQNYGNAPATAADLVSLTDTFDPLLTNITVTLNGAPFADYAYNDQTGEFATNQGAILVPACTYETDAATGVYSITPGSTTLIVSGTV